MSPERPRGAQAPVVPQHPPGRSASGGPLHDQPPIEGGRVNEQPLQNVRMTPQMRFAASMPRSEFDAFEITQQQKSEVNSQSQSRPASTTVL